MILKLHCMLMVAAEKNIFADDVRAAKLAEKRHNIAVIIARLLMRTDFSVHGATRTGYDEQTARDGEYISWEGKMSRYRRLIWRVSLVDNRIALTSWQCFAARRIPVCSTLLERASAGILLYCRRPGDFWSPDGWRRKDPDGRVGHWQRRLQALPRGKHGALIDILLCNIYQWKRRLLPRYSFHCEKCCPIVVLLRPTRRSGLAIYVCQESRVVR